VMRARVSGDDDPSIEADTSSDSSQDD
jgi:hypothetical protein